MKKIKILLSVAALAFVTSVAAENNRVFIGYDMPRVVWTGQGNFDAFKFNGFSAGYSHTFQLTESGLGVDAGAGLQYASYTNDDDKDWKSKGMNINIPIAVAYSIEVTDGIAIRPSLGIGFRLGLSNKETDDGGDNWYSNYDKDDVGGEDYTVSRFKMGWNIGATVDLSKFFVGYQYGSDFGDMGGDDFENLRFCYHSLRVGMKF